MKIGLFCALLWLTGAAAGQPFAYVPNEKSGTISVIDTVTDRVVRELAAGKRPRGIAVARGGTRVYVTDAASNALLTIATSGDGRSSTPLGKSPEGVALSADGRLLAAAVEESNSVTLIDAASGAVLADIKVQGKNPEHAVFSPDGRWLLVSAEDTEQVDVIDVGERRQVAALPSGCGHAASASRPTVRAPTSPPNWSTRCT